MTGETVMPLSPRLEMVLRLTPDAAVCCDVGTDHGLAAVRLALRGSRVIATDINRGPLERARANIRRWAVEDRVELRLSDGLSAIKPGEAGCAVIAGMGGELIAEILSKGTKDIPSFVLQPQSKHYELRDWLSKNGFRIVQEDICREGQRYYVAILAAHGGQEFLTEEEKHIGPRLIESRHLLLGGYLASRRRETEKILEKIGGASTPRRNECAALIEMYAKYGQGG